MQSFLQFIGGLAFFLYGMTVLADGLKRLDGGRAEEILSRMCSTPLRGVLLGALVTAAIQSSSATTVMVVGLVNAGVMTLRHAVGVIMGANLGTTLTAWILSLSGVSGDIPLLGLLKPVALSPILAVVGVLMLLASKRELVRAVGGGLCGLGILFSGMIAMSGAVEPLAESPQFANALLFFRNPLAGLLAGAVLTAAIQSSSASIGILQALTVTGAIRLGLAVPIVMGQNIGTCVTALLSGVGAEVNARRAAFVHLYFNTTGAVVLLAVFLALSATGVLPTDALLRESDVALIHTLFNVFSTLLLLPFSRLLLRLAVLTVPEK